MSQDGLTQDQIRQVLETRARALAQAPQPERPPDELQLMAFTLSGERYAFELRYVVEVFRPSSLSLLPVAAAPLVGITAWRGELLPIFDLRRVLGLSAQRLDDLTFAIVLGQERAPIAVLADAVDELLSVGREKVRPAPEGVAVHREFVRGITADTRLVLDAEGLLKSHG